MVCSVSRSGQLPSPLPPPRLWPRRRSPPQKLFESGNYGAVVERAASGAPEDIYSGRAWRI